MNKMRTILCLVLLLVLPAAARATVILNVNISNPAAVVFSTTMAAAESTFVDVDTAFNGVTLLGFLPGNTAAIDTFLDTGTIDVFDSSAGTTRSPLVNIWVGDWPGGWTPEELSFYEPVDIFPISFLDTERALVGSAAHDLSGLGGLGLARSGQVVVGEPGSGSVIGEWRVVPEPGPLLLLVAGLLALVWTRTNSERVAR